MSYHTVSRPPSQVNSPHIHKAKIRIGVPPVPRAQGDWMVFTHLPKRVKAELKARGWKFYVIHMASVGLDGQS